jgi:hypothetical protein
VCRVLGVSAIEFAPFVDDVFAIPFATPVPILRGPLTFRARQRARDSALAGAVAMVASIVLGTGILGVAVANLLATLAV